MGGVPFLGARIHAFMTSFIDSRDAGALLVSHFSLLAGARQSTTNPLKTLYLTPLIDSRDAGALLVSHFSLLAGARQSICTPETRGTLPYSCPCRARFPQCCFDAAGRGY